MRKIKIILIIIFVYGSVVFYSGKVFIADTPRIYPGVIAQLINLPNNIALIPATFLSGVQNLLAHKPSVSSSQPIAKNTQSGQPTENTVLDGLIQKIPVTQVSAGVYKGQDSAQGIVVYNVTADAPKSSVKYITSKDGTVHTVYYLK